MNRSGRDAVDPVRRYLFVELNNGRMRIRYVAELRTSRQEAKRRRRRQRPAGRNRC